MTLQKFKKESRSKRKVRGYFIHVTSHGIISFNKNLSAFLQLKDGVGVDFFQHVSNKRDWFIQINPDAENKVRRYKSLDYYQFNNSRLANEILTSIGADEKGVDSLRLPVAKLPADLEQVDGVYYAVLTNVIKLED